MLIILVLIFCVNTVSATKEIYVNTTGNDTTGTGTAKNPYLTIQKGVDNVDPNGVIRIANGNYSGNNNTQIIIKKNIKIIGQNYTKTIINGNGTSWLFKIQSGVKVTLCNLKIINGYVTGSGGAIQNQGNLTLSNCILINNTSSGDGGAILNYCTLNTNKSRLKYCVLNLNNCILTDNAAGENGGAISNQCTIDAKSKSVGACVINSNKCTFSNNTSGKDGGAISNQCTIDAESKSAGVCVLNLNNCILTDNAAGENGGAISNHSAIIVDGGRLGACVINLNNSIITGNTADKDGGAISNQCVVNINGTGLGACVLNLNKCTLTNNFAGKNGGTILNLCPININNSGSTKAALNVNECIFTGNNAGKNGGAIWNGGTANVHFNRIIGNKAQLGNAIYSVNTMSATDNWWGSNSPDFNSLISAADYVIVNHTPWLYLTFTAYPTIIPAGSSSKLTASFNQHTDGITVTPINPVNGHIPDGTPVIFTTNLGNVGSKFVEKYTFLGIAYAILRGDEGQGIASVSLIAYNQKLNATVIIIPTSAITIKSIGMQTTGTPLAGIVLAVLMVVGGFFNIRKK